MVDSNGYFYLKAGQSAQFANMGQYDNVGAEYIVQEILPDNVNGQYDGVEYSISGSGGTTETEKGEQSDFTSYSTASLAADETQMVLYRNKVDTSRLSALAIKKEKAPGSGFTGEEEFQIKVALGSSDKDLNPIPVGTTYRISSENSGENESKQVTTEGIISLKIGQTATLVDGILAGTHYKVSEVIGENSDIRVSYNGKVTSEDGMLEDPVADKNGVSGYVTTGDTVHITVTNADYDFAAKINISKTTVGFTEGSENDFNFKIELCDATGKVSGKSCQETQIHVIGNDTVSGTITVGFQSGTESGIHYYKITEIKPSAADPKIEYDDSVYIVGIETKNDGTAKVVNVNGINVNEDKTLAFTNIYDNTTIVELTKKVTGGFGDIEKEFTFHMTLDKGSFPSNYESGSNEGVGYTPSNDGMKAEITLKHNQKIILKLPAGTKLSIAENEYTGYETSYVIDTSESVPGRDANNIELKKGSPVHVTFTNCNKPNADTGISMDSLPYILILAAVAAGAVFFVIRKRKESDLD